MQLHGASTQRDDKAETARSQLPESSELQKPKPPRRLERSQERRVPPAPSASAPAPLLHKREARGVPEVPALAADAAGPAEDMFARAPAKESADTFVAPVTPELALSAEPVQLWWIRGCGMGWGRPKSGSLSSRRWAWWWQL